MRSEIQRHVIQLLHGGHALDGAQRAAAINELGRRIGRTPGIATGEIDVEHPKLRIKAIAALGFDETEPELSARVLSDLVNEGPPRLALQAVRALGRLPADRRDQFRALVRDPETPPAVALAAARLAAGPGGEDVVAELRDLRRRLRAYVERDDSPSLVSIDRLIARRASGNAHPRAPTHCIGGRERATGCLGRRNWMATQEQVVVRYWTWCRGWLESRIHVGNPHRDAVVLRVRACQGDEVGDLLPVRRLRGWEALRVERLVLPRSGQRLRLQRTPMFQDPAK